MTLEQMTYFDDPTRAGLRDTLAAWRRSYPAGGVMAILPEAQRDALPLVQAACRAESLPLAGAIFPALLVNDEFRSTGVLLARFDEMPFTALIPCPTGEEATAKAIADVIQPHLGSERSTTLFMVFDAMVPNIASILERLYLQLADRVHYLGVNAGSESFKPMPCLFDDTRMIEHGVLVALLKAHRGGVLEHGYIAPETMVSATSTDHNRIIEIDWRPAFEVYTSVMRTQYGVEINRENFYQHAVHFPFGIMRANGEILVRIPVALQDDGSLFCVGEVPPNAILTLLSAPAVDSIHTIDTLVKGLTAAYGPMVGRQILTFYCAGRRLHIGEQATNELRQLLHRSGANGIFGALSLGEIGSSVHGGYPLFHNGTLVCSPWTGR
jgi:hypothetical protein